MHDRVGIGWRPELSASIFCNLDAIEIVEIIADDLFSAPTQVLNSIQTLSTQVPVTLHGVGMGLASITAVEERRLQKMSKLVRQVRPDSWSEHLSFVRSGGYEIGHLAAPPRTAANIRGAIRNIRRAAEVVGSAPLLENIATLIEPPCSEMGEGTWIASILTGSDTNLLIDLHNLYANALNFGFNPSDYLLSFPLERVRSVHLSGGHWIREPNSESRRLLDDHVHDVPSEVFELLVILAERAFHPLTVIIERDGSYPTFDLLLHQIDLARRALKAGRRKNKKVEEVA
jgi:uncharacterized protein (UPF0276 family)